jgi:hypothetical protein
VLQVSVTPLKCTLHRQFIMYELLFFLYIRIIECRLFQWSYIKVICHVYVSLVQYIIVHAAMLRLRSHVGYRKQGSMFTEPCQLHCLLAVAFTLRTVFVVHNVFRV